MAAFGCEPVADRQDAAAAPQLGTALQHAAELSEAGAYEPALALLDCALAVHADAADLYTARGWALENLTPPRCAEARDAYRCALALDPRQLWAQVGLATVLGQLGETASCPPIYREAAKQAHERAAQEPEYLELIGWCEYRLGRLDDAAATFARALAIDAGWISVRFDLGLVRLLLGDGDEAAQHYRDGLATLAKPDVPTRTGSLKVALDDLDEALQQQPAVGALPTAASIRAQLARALADAW